MKILSILLILFFFSHNVFGMCAKVFDPKSQKRNNKVVSIRSKQHTIHPSEEILNAYMYEMLPQKEREDVYKEIEGDAELLEKTIERKTLSPRDFSAPFEQSSPL